MRQFLFFTIVLNSLILSQNLWAGIEFGNVNAIYKTDDREVVSRKSPARIQEIARAIGYIISNDYLTKGLFKTTIQANSLKNEANMCVDEKFVKFPSASNCTGFLVDKDIMISAGHCFETESDCSSKKIIFDLDEKKQSENGYSVFNTAVFSCKRIIVQSFSDEADYSIIQLEKVPAGRKPLVLNTQKKISDDSKVFMVGHPMGLPQIYSKAARIVDNMNPSKFKAELDSFSGNSGSPVINAKTFQVEGILVGGQEDLVFDSENFCYRNMTYENSGGESVFRSSNLPAF